MKCTCVTCGLTEFGWQWYLRHLTRYIKYSEIPRVKVSSDPCAWCHTNGGGDAEEDQWGGDAEEGWRGRGLVSVFRKSLVSANVPSRKGKN